MADFDRITEALSRVYGYDSFRTGQREAVEALLDGRDLMAIMPTGGGKSICYQLPSIVDNTLSIVISPLISLMKDQVDQLRQLGVEAAALNSTVDQDEARAIMAAAHRGELRLLYIAPERIDYEGCRESLWACGVRRIIIDEAHCVSQWGHDFRTSYLGIADFIDGFAVRPTVAAFTATATQRVAEDICALLRLQSPVEVRTGFDRTNLAFSSWRIPKSKRLDWIRSYISQHPGECGIIYCSSRKDTEKLASELGALCYHAGLTDAERERAQNEFINDRNNVICATNAFGMGIDKPNVRYVIHYHAPSSIEAYWQEAGRAGRDGLDAECVLLADGADRAFWSTMIMRDTTDEAERQRKLKRLYAMTDYTHATGCLRKYLVGYFGEVISDCGVCSNCVGGETVDITRDAQMILSAVARCGERVGKQMVARVLLGSKDQKLLARGFDKLSTYGIMRGADRRALADKIDELIAQGYLQQSEGEYPILHLTEQSVGVLRSERQVTMRVSQQYEASDDKSAANRRTSSRNSRKQYAQDPLFIRLKALRRQIADENNVPPFVVFDDKTLIDMAQKRPTTLDAFSGVIGVGAYKLKRYGEVFTREISDYIGETSTGVEHGVQELPLKSGESVQQIRTAARLREAPEYTTEKAQLSPRLISDMILFINTHKAEFLRDFSEHTDADVAELLKLMRSLDTKDD